MIFDGKKRVVYTNASYTGYMEDNLDELFKDAKKFTFTKSLLKYIVEPKLTQNIKDCKDIVCIGSKIVENRHTLSMSMSAEEGSLSDQRYNLFILNYGNMINGHSNLSNDQEFQTDCQLFLVWSGCYYQLSGSYTNQ